MFILYKNIHTKKRQRKLKILYVHFLYVHVSLSQIPNPIGLFDTFFVIAATQPFSKDDVCYNSPPHLFWPIGVGHMTSDFVRPIVANIILTQMLRCRNGKVLPIYKNTLWLYRVFYQGYGEEDQLLSISMLLHHSRRGGVVCSIFTY
jgi:hypothetical protein